MKIHHNPASTSKIRNAMNASSLSLTEISRRIQVSDSVLSRYRSGLRKPSPGTLARLASVLGVPVTDLMDSESADE